jgi:hypothetical protein
MTRAKKLEDDVSVRRPPVKFLELHGFAATTDTADEGRVRRDLPDSAPDLALRTWAALRHVSNDAAGSIPYATIAYKQ